MARAALRLTADDLSQSSGVSRATVQRIETFDGEPQSTKANLAAIQRALEAAGVQFIEGGAKLAPVTNESLSRDAG